MEGEAPNAKSILCQYDDSTCIEVGLDIEMVVQEYPSLPFGYTALATEQDNAQIRCSTCRQQISEISVGRHHRSRLGKSGPDDRIVWCAEQAAVAGKHRIMPGVDQQRTQPGAQALIDQESQAGIRNGSCRSSTAAAAKLKRSADIGRRQLRILCRNLLSIEPFGNQTDDRRNWYTGRAGFGTLFGAAAILWTASTLVSGRPGGRAAGAATARVCRRCCACRAPRCCPTRAMRTSRDTMW